MGPSIKELHSSGRRRWDLVIHCVHYDNNDYLGNVQVIATKPVIMLKLDRQLALPLNLCHDVGM